MKRSRRSAAERFWPKVQKGDGCWLWTGAHDKAGYGMFHMRPSRDSKPTGAHRAAYELTHGPIPAGLCVCHRCDTPDCVRPDHLFLGTQQDNIDDMVKKGRNRGGGDFHPVACRNGHTRTPENTCINKQGHRYCRICLRVKDRRLRSRRQQQQAASSAS